MNKYDISVVLGSKNRKQLLKSTIESIRNNGFCGNIEIIVVDGGSTDGSCDWLAKQKDVFTIIQPNYKVTDSEGINVLAHSWGKFMNIGFKQASAPWIVMVSDDLILAPGSLQKGYDDLNQKINNGEKIGGGAFFFREYPRHDYFRVGYLPNDHILINHGFYYKKALSDINFIEENEFNFYCADGDLAMRLNEKGWKTIPLENSYAIHLNHKPKFGKNPVSPSTKRDIDRFNKKFPYKITEEYIIKKVKIKVNIYPFWKFAFLNCIFGLLLKYYDRFYNKKTNPVRNN